MGATAGASSVAQGITSVGNGYIQAAAMRDQAGFTKTIAGMNNQRLEAQAGLQEEAATDAVRRGNTAANKSAEQQRLQVGAIRAQAASTGGSGGAASDAASNAIEQVSDASATNQAALKVNAYREAFGLQSAAIATRGQEAANNYNAATKANQLDYMAKSSMISGWTKGLGFGMQAASDYTKNSKSSSGDDDEEG